MTVEVDESLFTRRKNHQRRVLPQQWVFGGWCRETKESFMYTVPDRSAPTLLPIIQNAIRPGTTIMSDLWRAYGGIGAIQGMGFDHLTVNHSVNFVDPITGAQTRRAELSTATMSRQIKTFEFRGVSLARLLRKRQNPKKERISISLSANIDLIFIF